MAITPIVCFLGLLATLQFTEANWGDYMEYDFSTAKRCEYPSVALVTFTTRKGEYSCGGTLIDNYNVLTAAHCIIPGVFRIRVNLGIIRSDKRGSMRSYRRIISYTKYESKHRHHDLAIVVLSRKVSNSRCIKPTKLATPGQKYEGQICEALGWGPTTFERTTKTLKKVRLSIVPYNTCKYKTHLTDLQDNQICAGHFIQGSIGTCVGDSGGPLFCRGKDGTRHLAGIASIGKVCKFSHSIFTSVAAHKEWIEKQT